MILIGLARAASLSGTVTDATGAPVPAATVVAYGPGWNAVSTSTDEGGAWWIAGVDPGRYRVWVEPDGSSRAIPGWIGGGWEVCDAAVYTLAEGEALEGVDVTLDTGMFVAGALLDGDGAALAGATVDMLVDHGKTYSRSGLSDTEGRFRIGGIEAGSTVRVIARPVEHVPDQYLGAGYDDTTATTWTVDDDLDLGSATLLPGILVTGTVSGPGGPVGGATVYVYSGGQAVGVTADEDGVYVADALPPGDVLAWAAAEGFATTYWPDEPAPMDMLYAEADGEVVTADLSLPAESTLQVRVADDDSLQGASVMLYNETYTVGLGRGVDETGVATFDGLWPGDYFLALYGADQGLVEGEVEEDGASRVFHVEGDTVVEVEPEPAASLALRIVRDDGQPAEGSVTVEALDDILGYRTTDLADRVVVPGLRAAEATVSLVSGWSCEGDPSFADTWLDGARVAEDASPIDLEPPEELDLGDVIVPADDDHDGMGDAWERVHGLDPERQDDAADLDGDGYTNVEEWRMDTDPNGYVGSEGCGCTTGGAGGWLSLLCAAAARRGRGRPSRERRPGTR